MKMDTAGISDGWDAAMMMTTMIIPLEFFNREGTNYTENEEACRLSLTRTYFYSAFLRGIPLRVGRFLFNPEIPRACCATRDKNNKNILLLFSKDL